MAERFGGLLDERLVDVGNEPSALGEAAADAERKGYVLVCSRASLLPAH
ncbi:MAG: hypothetical protein Q8O56_12640 [Solirubrobacteraceae bacterium]|nr:hypothetical protein [Solirubrobacteraceae bacterium]